MVSFVRLLALFVPAVMALQFQHMEDAIIDVRDDFVKTGYPSPDTYHEVVFAVKQKNLDKLEKLFFEVSDPSHSKYGQFLSRDEVGELTSNGHSTIAVSNFLREHGVKDLKVAPYGEYIKAYAPIKTWEKLFATTFYTYAHVENRMKPVNRAVHYSVPTDLLQHVETVFNTVQFPSRLPEKKLVSLKDSAAPGSVTPALINSYYHVTSNVGSTKASQSVFESLEQYFSPADLSTFETQYNIPQEPVATDIGGYSSDSECQKNPNNCAEANLDVQYLIGISQVTPTTYWYENSTDSFIAWIQEVAASTNPPLVNSISYGSIENELPKSLANTFNVEAQKLGVQGVTILVSSGDDGVANFQARSNPKKCGYNPSFPASSPYVTAVGATQGPEDNKPEIACQSNQGGVITTGGGFSTLFNAPSYQKNTVNNYFAGLSASQIPATGYNKAGRAYPDVSIAGHNYEVVIGGKTYAVSGTSASSPVVAAFVSLVNAARLEAGKKPLGFLNQAIYKNGVSFSNDITSGENNCCASNVCCTQGFYATKGWDPLTGFGSVDYQKFYNLFFNL